MVKGQFEVGAALYTSFVSSERIEEAAKGEFLPGTSVSELQAALRNLPDAKRSLPQGAPRVLGLVGYLRSGKDVVASYIQEEYRGVVRLAFSDPIIDECNEFLRRWGHKITESNKSDYRLLLQSWSMARRSESESYWSERLCAEIDRALDEGAQLVILSGARLPADVELIEQYGGELWRVQRPGGEKSDHPNEAWIDSIACSREILNSREGDTSPLLPQIREAFGD